jgi:hypothetical protein
MISQGVIRLGTSAFTAAGWPGRFNPDNLKPADYLTYYATQFAGRPHTGTASYFPSLRSYLFQSIVPPCKGSQRGAALIPLVSGNQARCRRRDSFVRSCRTPGKVIRRDRGLR